jgi:hypothetical protein
VHDDDINNNNNNNNNNKSVCLLKCLPTTLRPITVTHWGGGLPDDDGDSNNSNFRSGIKTFS